MWRIITHHSPSRRRPPKEWVTDVDGVRYLDRLGAYSAVNFGHRNPRIVAAVTGTTKPGDPHEPGVPGPTGLEPFCTALADLCGKDMVLPMNTGAEAVESAIRWPENGAMT